DAELASLVAPRALVVEAARGPEFSIPTATGGAPGRLTTPRLEQVRREVARAESLVRELHPRESTEGIVSGEDGLGPFGSSRAVQQLTANLRLGDAVPDVPIGEELKPLVA